MCRPVPPGGPAGIFFRLDVFLPSALSVGGESSTVPVVPPVEYDYCGATLNDDRG